TKAESLAYIEHRLNNVSTKPRAVFSSQALNLIVKTGNGIPRKLNILCDNALITGFGYQQSTISDKIAKEVIADINGHRFHAGWRILARYAVVMIVVALPVILYLVHSSAIPDVKVGVLSPSRNESQQMSIGQGSVRRTDR